jgi:hypothetical protein
MGKIVVSENLTLDGVAQEPTGEEGFRHGGRFLQAGSNDPEGFYRTALDEALGADALLQGRRTHEFLAARWPSRSGELVPLRLVASRTVGDALAYLTYEVVRTA